MPFIESNDKYQKWKYVVNEFYILYPDGDTTAVPNHRVQSISISHLYETNLFPIFRVELVLSAHTYYKIIKNKDKIKFKLRIQKYYTEIGSSEKSLYRDWINDSFDLILDDDDFFADESLIKEQRESDYSLTTHEDLENDLFKVDNVIEFFLYKSELVGKMNTMVNAIISNASLSDGIQYIASQAGFDNLLMSPIHNTKTYKELVVPPLKAKQAIKFLDTYYGLYRTGMMFYGDMIDNITYLIEYSSKCTAYQNRELRETDIMIPKKSSKYSGDLCSLYRRDNNEKYFIIGNNGLSIRNESISYNAYASADIKVVDTYQGDISTSSSTAKVKDNKSVQIIENNTENSWFTEIYNSFINSKNVVMDIMLADYDVSAVAPNKLFKVVFEDSALSLKYKKNLLLAEAHHSLIKEGNDFTLSSTIKLRQA